MGTFSMPSGTIAFAVAASLLSGCWVKTSVCRGLGNARPDSCKDDSADDASETSGAPVGGGQPNGGDTSVPIPTTTVDEYVPGTGYALARVNPEQLSNNLAYSTNYGATELRYDDPTAGQKIDFIVSAFGVPLGGIDFQATSRRDGSTKAQTLLVSRVVASQLAGAALWKDFQLASGSRVLFTKCDLENDRPFGAAGDGQLNAAWQDAIKQGEVRWQAQVEEFFWRFYSRPPTSSEITAVKTAFIESYDVEGWPPLAWITILYALMASQEFWHI